MKMQAYVLELKNGVTLDILKENKIIDTIEGMGDEHPFIKYVKNDFMLTNNIKDLYKLRTFDSQGGAQWFIVGVLKCGVSRIKEFDPYGYWTAEERTSWYFYLSERYGHYWINGLTKDNAGNYIASCGIEEIRNKQFIRMEIGILKPIVI